MTINTYIVELHPYDQSFESIRTLPHFTNNEKHQIEGLFLESLLTFYAHKNGFSQDVERIESHPRLQHITIDCTQNFIEHLQTWNFVKKITRCNSNIIALRKKSPKVI